MARTYSARLVALTVGAQLKLVDNLLSHHDLPGVSRSRQGRERRITDEGLLAIELVLKLNGEFGIPLASATTIVSKALVARTASEMQFTAESGVTLLFPVLEIERRLRERMVEAVEAVARVPRGRPRREPS